MVSSSSSSSSCSSIVTVPSSSFSAASPPKKYDVFISFRGEDTRKTFTSHLEDALRRNKIETYIDYRLQKGEGVWPALVKAIHDSNIFVVIFSENYASSTWCLNELLEIMECKEEKGQHDVVIPVFYEIDPSHVRKQRGSYRTAFAKHKRDPKHSKDKVRKWKAALSEVANVVGFDSRRYRTPVDLIKDVIKEVLQKLDHKYPNELSSPSIIFNENCANVEQLLSTKSDEVQIIGIWGMGGIGKTTIAAAVFDKVSSQYAGRCFMENVREELGRHGLNHLRKKLLSELLGKESKVRSSFVMSRLRRKEVFIVLDDVNTSEDLDNLVPRYNSLKAGSKIIMTSRDKHVFKSEVEIYQTKKMNFQDSLRLFRSNAFDKTHLENGYEELSHRAIDYAQGIPLALKVLGSFLRSKSEKEWDSALRKLKKFPNTKIQKVLRLSLDELDMQERNIFLDVACFLKGWEKDRVIKLLNGCGLFGDIGIQTLLDKALITISSHDCIEIHDLIQEMGQEIVREESVKSSRGQSRLWDFEKVCNVLENDKGTDAVEGIFLDMTETSDLYLSSHAFTKMTNLRLLSFIVGWRPYKETHNCVYLQTGLESLPNSLRYINWERYPLKSLPSTFSPKNLVELSMIDSKVEQLWNKFQNLPNLEMLLLYHSRHLMELPDLSGAPNLKVVGLTGCTSLSHVHPSIFSLQKLEILLMDRCEALKSLSSSNLSASLQVLSAQNCSNLQEFSLKVDHYTGHLSLGLTAINELPSSILHLRNFGHFSFPISESLMDLPENFTDNLELTDSRQHQHDALVVVRTLLQHSSGFRYVRCLSFNYCRTLSELPDNISLLSSLEELLLFSSHLISLPESIKYLPRLKLVDLRFSEKFQSLPELPQSIQSLQAGGCISLKAVTSLTNGPPKKHHCTFQFENCLELDQDAINNSLKGALTRMEEAKPPSETVFEDEKDGTICFCLPVDRIRVLDSWLHCCSRQAWTTVELDPNLKFFGFIFCLVVSQVPLVAMEDIENLGCECILETGSGEQVHITSFFLYGDCYRRQLRDSDKYRLLSDHAYLWHDTDCCQQIMEVIKESRAVNDGDGRNTHIPTLTFEFFAVKDNDEAVGIKERGVHLIYPSGDQMVEQGDGCKSKRSREIHELEEPIPASAIPIGVEGSEEHKDEQQEPILDVTPTKEIHRLLADELPPTKKFKP